MPQHLLQLKNSLIHSLYATIYEKILFTYFQELILNKKTQVVRTMHEN
jgi:hypothetical protein